MRILVLRKTYISHHRKIFKCGMRLISAGGRDEEKAGGFNY